MTLDNAQKPCPLAQQM